MGTTHGSLSNQSRNRLQAGELMLKGLDDDEITYILDVILSSVKRWRRKLNLHDNDLSCLVRKKGSGRPPRLSDDEKQRLKEIILGGAVEAGYPSERWTSRNVADLIRDEFEVELAPRTVRDLLPTLGLSPQMPVVKSHKHSDEDVICWSRNAWERIKKKRRNSTHS
jgi:transposase